MVKNLSMLMFVMLFILFFQLPQAFSAQTLEVEFLFNVKVNPEGYKLNKDGVQVCSVLVSDVKDSTDPELLSKGGKYFTCESNIDYPYGDNPGFQLIVYANGVESLASPEYVFVNIPPTPTINVIRVKNTKITVIVE